MYLTNRDMEFLTDLFYIKYINSKRVVKLFPSYKSAIQRLKELKDNDYIKVIDYLVNGEQVFCITKKGAGSIDMLEDFKGATKTDKLKHSLATGDFYFNLKSENKAIQSFKVELVFKFKHEGKRCEFRPDALVITKKPLFVEIDLSNRRFEEKIITWEAFYRSMAYTKFFKLYPPIVIVTTKPEKIKQIIDKNKTINLNYIVKDYEEIREWSYKY